MRSGGGRVKIVRKKLASGEVREYSYAPKPPRQRVAPDSVGAMILAYRASPEFAALRPMTKKHKAIYLRDLEDLAGVPAAKVLRRTMLAMRDVIAAERGTGAANAFLKVSGAVFSWARDRGWLEHSPVDRAKRLPGGHLAAWTAAEADDATRRLPEHLARAVILARHTGQRRGDLCALRWSAYDGHAIRLTQAKTGAALVIPATPDLRAALDAWKRDAKSLHILTTKDGRPWKPIYLTMAMRAALRELGMRDALNVHGLRKLAATTLAEAGCSAHEIAAITGHKTLAMVQLYTASADQERLAAGAIVRLETGRRKP